MLPALGITDEVETLGLKGNKKKKSKKLDEDFKSGAVRLVFETGKLNAQEAQGAEVKQGSPR